MKIEKFSIRTFILMVLVVMLPVLFLIYSPMIMVLGVLNGVITLSAIIFGVWFFLSMFFGRAASCGYTCPYGALQEVFGGKILKKKVPGGKADYLRYFIFASFLAVVMYSLLSIHKIQGLDLFASQGIYSVLGIGGQQLILLIPLSILTIGFISIVFGSRAFCRYICPHGVFLTIGTKLGDRLNLQLLKLSFHNDKCSNCELCNKSCPMGIEVKQIAQKKAQENKTGKNDKSSIIDSNCILCGECALKCPKDAINYSLKL